MRREELLRYLDEQLQTARFKDYCPNGLQVEGRPEVRHIVTGVTASQALLDHAVARGADTVLVHHGYFWRGEDARITGLRRQRIGTLIGAGINLLAYHLPLDAHPVWGNNAQLAQRLGIVPEGRFGEQDIGWHGSLPAPESAEAFAARAAEVLGREPLLLGDGSRTVRRIAWCSGGAQGYFEAAVALGADLYFSGEVSEPTYHLARESGVPYLACGHHATERYGAQALGEHLAAQFGLQCEFFDDSNPV